MKSAVPQQLEAPTPARRQPVEWRPMLPSERRMATALAKCSFLPGSFAKRFARTVGSQAEEPEPRITEGQAAVLRTLVHAYRRQIPAAVVALVRGNSEDGE